MSSQLKIILSIGRHMGNVRHYDQFNKALNMNPIVLMQRYMQQALTTDW